ncbi:MAG TPA: MarR family winged helix-turn-helix transcriptional regulator [Hyphomonadaceae bacterium]|nr:MarR family winged helix-turn-helix transcriptional regulator [Hyphomonadaceae bacterium]HPI49299.1 MarR family winged helix-turn-helix transcriptional regulator [Hyphomonadaceae bacterium]
MPDQFASRKGGTVEAVTAAASAGATTVSAMSADACILRHVARVSRAVVAAYDPALAPFGLTGHQFNLMMTLGNMGPMTVGALAETLGMDASGVPRAIRPLADEGFISVERGEDRRQRVLSLTPMGRSRLEKATPAWTRVQAELVEAIGASRWVSLMGELRTVRKAATSCSTRRSDD